MTADVNETKAARRKLPPVGAILFGANAVTQFAIQAWLAYGFADKVWKLRHPLPWIVPVALDVFAIALMYATYQLRDAPLRQRAYAWFWLGVAIAAQVGASEGFADHENWSAWGRTASLVPAVFLAASLHAIIIVVRRTSSIPAPLLAAADTGPGWWSRRRTARRVAREIKAERKALGDRPVNVQVTPRITQATAHAVTAARLEPIEIIFPRLAVTKAADQRELPAPPPPPDTVPVPQIDTGPVPEVEAPPAPRRERRAAARGKAPAVPPTPGRRPTGRPADPRQADVIKRCVDGEEDAATVARDLGVNVRTAQLWVKNERAIRAGKSRTVNAYPSGGVHEIARPGSGLSDAPLPKGN